MSPMTASTMNTMIAPVAIPAAIPVENPVLSLLEAAGGLAALLVGLVKALAVRAMVVPDGTPLGGSGGTVLEYAYVLAIA
jgi:hypothetical protein